MHGEYKVPGGKLVVVDLEIHEDRLAGVRVSGDFFLEPDSALDAINAALCGLPVGTVAPAGAGAQVAEADIAAAVRAALPQGTMLYGITPEGVAIAVQRALAEGDAT